MSRGSELQASLPPLLERRLIIVTGKGGTGKTSVVAALGLAAARAGKRVLLIETGLAENLPRLLADAGSTPGLETQRIEPYEALGEYLGLQLRVRGLVDRVLANRGFRQLMDAAPGWRELITLGKVWHLEQQRDAMERPLYDLLVVDAPATGHGLTFLDVPSVVVSAVRAGPLRRDAARVQDMLRDPRTTTLLPVALAEELPARETTELIERLESGIGIAVDRVVVNALVERPVPAEVGALDERLARLAARGHDPAFPDPALLARCAAHLRARFELGQDYLGKIGAWTGLPTVPLPFIPEGVSGRAALTVLADHLVPRASREATS